MVCGWLDCVRGIHPVFVSSSNWRTKVAVHPEWCDRSMKKKHFQIIAAVLVLLAVTLYVWFFGGPFRFVERPLSEDSLAYLASGAAGRGSPEEVADEYLHGLLHPADRPHRRTLDISVSQPNAAEAVVTVIDRHSGGDSVSVSCDRVTLRLQNSRWTPVRHQAAWQGRGLIGWSTKPAK